MAASFEAPDAAFERTNRELRAPAAVASSMPWNCSPRKTSPGRREERKPVRATVAIVPRNGAYKHMKVTCTAIDYSQHGLSVAAQFPLSTAAADLFLKARDEPIAVKIVNLRPQAGVDGYVVGLTTEDGQPLPEDVLRELAAAEREERR